VKFIFFLAPDIKNLILVTNLLPQH